MYKATRGIRSYEKSSSSSEEASRIREHRKLVENHGGLVRKVAQRILRRLPPYVRGIELDDLVSIGVMGLLDAHNRYDPDGGRPFETYAEFRIKGAILDSLRKQDFFPRRLRQKANKYHAAQTRLREQLGRDPTDDEMADAMNLDLEAFQRLKGKVAPYSFVDEADVAYSLTASTPDSYEIVDYKQTRETLVASIEQLPERQQLILDLYFNKELTLSEIGEILELSPGRISQLKSAAIAELRRLMR